MMHGSGRAEPFNLVQCDPDLNLDGVCASEDEGINAGALLARVQEQLALPALPTDVRAIGVSKASLIGNNDGVSPRLVVGFDTPHGRRRSAPQGHGNRPRRIALSFKANETSGLNCLRAG